MSREMPNAVSLEQSVLGSLMVYPRVIQDCQELDLHAEEFYLPSHQQIYQAICTIHENGQPIDMNTVVNRLQETDTSVKSEVCSQRIFKILTDGAELTTTRVEQEFNSSFTTSETKDGKYKLSLYDTVDLEDKVDSLGETRPCGKLKFEEDYNLDGVKETVKYSDHWSWIYTLRNNPSDASGTHIWNWAATYMKDATPVEPEKPTTPENKPSTDKTDKIHELRKHIHKKRSD